MGAVLSATDIHDRGNFDVVMSFMNSLNNTPESNIWYEFEPAVQSALPATAR